MRVCLRYDCLFVRFSGSMLQTLETIFHLSTCITESDERYIDKRVFTLFAMDTTGQQEVTGNKERLHREGIVLQQCLCMTVPGLSVRALAFLTDLNPNIRLSCRPDSK